jgi:hypothetical protein
MRGSVDVLGSADARVSATAGGAGASAGQDLEPDLADVGSVSDGARPAVEPSSGVEAPHPHPDRTSPLPLAQQRAVPSAVASPAPVSPTSAPAGVAGRGAALAVAVGAVGAVIGSALPWSTMSSGDETRSFTGVVVGDGRVVLVLAVCLGAVAVARLLRRPLSAGTADILVARLVSGAIIVLAALDRMYGPPTLASFRAVSGDRIAIHPGGGIMLTLASGVVALIGAILLRPPRRGRGR